MKAIISYFDKQALVSSASEAIEFINSLTLRNNPKCQRISCNAGTEATLDLIFNHAYENEEGVIGYDYKPRMSQFSHFTPVFPKEIATTGCSTTRIYLYKPLGETLEEHQMAYQAKMDAERAERIAEAHRRREMRLDALNVEKEGWYYVQLQDIKVIGTFNRGNDHPIYKDFSGKVIAKSGADAYHKAVKHLEETMMNDCTTDNFTYWHHECPDMLSHNYYFSYIGVLTDDIEF